MAFLLPILASLSILFTGVFGQCPAADHCSCTGKDVVCKGVDNSAKLDEILTSMAGNNTDTENLSFIDGNIVSLRKDMFKGLANLKTLTFVNTKFAGSSGLNEEAFNGLTMLTTFRLTKNNKDEHGEVPIKFPENIFKPLTGLKLLQLDNNRLAVSPSRGVFNGLEQLEVLDLSANNINKPEAGTLSVLKGLKTLILTSNGINSLSPDVFTGLDKLETLVLSKNPAVDLEEDTLSKLHSLKNFVLRSNQLSEINPQSLSSVKGTLETLDLSSNNIATVKDNTFTGLSALKLLNLSSQTSGIKTFEPSAFAGLDGLVTLDLSGNALSHMKPAAFEPIASARLILDGNRFFCNCEMMEMRNWILTKSKATKVRCSYPPRLINKNIVDVDPVADIGCKPPRFTKLDEEVRGEEGTTVTFSCAVSNRHELPDMSYTILSGNPLPVKRSQVEMKNSSDTDNYHTMTYIFTVSNVTQADNGQIRCTGKGSYATVTGVLDISYGQTGLPLWAIIVIVVVIILLIVIFIVGVVLYRKRRYKAVRQ